MPRYRRHPDLTRDEVEVLNRIESELRLRGHAKKTQKAYLGYCRRFLQWKRSFAEMDNRKCAPIWSGSLSSVG